MRQFNTGHVITKQGEKAAIECIIKFDKNGFSKEKARDKAKQMITLLDVGAIRMPLEVSEFKDDPYYWSCYFRYFPGKEEDYENVKDGNHINDLKY